MRLFTVAHIGCVSCREYVQRAFEKCETEADKDQTEQYLKNMLTNAFKDGSAWVIDWDKELLPRYSWNDCLYQVTEYKNQSNKGLEYK